MTWFIHFLLFYREEQPEHRIHSVPGAMRNPEGVSYEAKPLICIYCGSETKVGNSRHQKRNNQVWRRRQCKRCKAIFTTHEAVDLSSTLLVQINGAPRPFTSDILFTELLLAMQDRKDCYLAAREATATIVAKLLKLPGKPLFSPSQISLISADVLKKLDKRAYLRFVSEHPSLQK